jgi:hypothetical protein
MRSIGLVAFAAAAAVGVTSPADAAVNYLLNPVRVTGTQTITTTGVNCGALCGVASSFYEDTVSGPLTFTGRDGNVEYYSFNNIAYDYSGTVSLTFEAATGVLLETSLAGALSVCVPCGNDFRVVREARFTGREFALLAFDGGAPKLLAPIPEPSTWAMMLLGFGAIGASMRRRRHGAFIRQAV